MIKVLPKDRIFCLGKEKPRIEPERIFEYIRIRPSRRTGKMLKQQS